MPTGTPLDELHAIFVDLTAKIEAGLIGLDDALAELRLHEVADAAGFTWRIDPMTQSFIRRAAGEGTWRAAGPAQYARDASGPPAGDPPAAERAASAPGPASPPNAFTFDLPGMEPAEPYPPAGRGGSARPRRKRVLVLAAAVPVVAALAGGMAAAGNARKPAPPARLTVPRTTLTPPGGPAPAPAVTQQAPPLSQDELARYQPVDVKAVAAAQQVLVTWRLPADAQADGAGIIVRRAPADGLDGLSALSRTNGRLPLTYVAVPLESGRRYCFLVGVLLKKESGGTTLAQAAPVCATPR